MAQNFTVPPEQEGQRLDRWLKKTLKGIPYSLIQKWFRLKRVRDKDGTSLKGECRLESGQIIITPEIEISEQNFPKKSPHAPSLEKKKILAEKFQKILVSEEKDFLIISKPQGIATQGGTGQKTSIDAWAQAWAEVFDRPRPLIVHRLDKETSGALLMALNRKSAQHFSELLRSHTLQKEYWALVSSIPKKTSGSITFSLEKSKTDRGERVVTDPQGQEALSQYKVIKSLPKMKVSWLSLFPITGRMHQLRVHCAASGFPIIGDWKYGGGKAQPFSDKKRLHLHSYRLSFEDTQGKMREFCVPLTDPMLTTWEDLELPFL
ncbi:MAG: RluA family pseudouridine synthase [bacterium]|nr:RluA family pseudouridine synthase [bacterium]